MIKTIGNYFMMQSVGLYSLFLGHGLTSPENPEYKIEGWNMRFIFYAMAVLLISVWAINYFVYQEGAIVHLTLVNAVVFVIAGTIIKNKNGK